MANLTVKDLVLPSIAGTDLFNDSESFLQDLSEHELELHGGGCGGNPVVKFNRQTKPIIVINSCAPNPEVLF
jgi:hypothetical protein